MVMKEMDTQEKIRDAARQLFMEKGYEATSVRDIAGLAGANLALVNYYFKSKENLFLEIMQEKVRALFGNIVPVITDDSIPLEEKLDIMVDSYLTVVSADHNLPVFIFSELNRQGGRFAKLIPASDIVGSSILRQIAERQPGINPVHFILNILSMAFFPYIVAPLIVGTGIVAEEEMRRLMKERVRLIPEWSKILINLKI